MSEILVEEERERLERLLSTPLLLPQEFKDWLIDLVERKTPMIPYTQILGARLNTAKSAQVINTSEITGSGTYADLTTPGPLVENLVDGQFLILYGDNVGSALPLSSLSLNGSTPSDDDALARTGANGTVGSSAFRGVIKTAKNDNQNTIKMQYKTTGGGGPAWSRRWMALFRVSGG